MRWWPDGAARLGFAALALGALAGIAREFDWPFAPPAWAVWTLMIPGLVAFSAIRFSRRFYQRTAMTYDEEFPVAAHARVKPGGSFEWHPEGEQRIQVRHGLVHRWWDAERGARYDVRLRFEIPDEVPPDLLVAATKRALRSAKRVLPARGKVRASAAHRDDPGPSGTVSVRLAVQGIGATPEWARAAAEEFARAFLVGLKQEGHLADRRA